MIGLEVACVLIALASLRTFARGLATSNSFAARAARRIAFMPPLIQGVGLLALPWLAGLASASMAEAGHLRPLARRAGQIRHRT